MFDGLAIGLMPLSAIMTEVMQQRADIAFVTMEGDIQCATGEESCVNLSDTIDNIVNSGKYKMIIGLSLKNVIFVPDLSYI